MSSKKNRPQAKKRNSRALWLKKQALKAQEAKQTKKAVYKYQKYFAYAILTSIILGVLAFIYSLISR